MKTAKLRFLFLLLSLPTGLLGQTMDSSVVKIVDSLHLLVRAQTLQSNFEQALATTQIIENLALEHAGRMSEPYANACFARGRTYFFKGDFEGAEKWYLTAKDIREKVNGTETAEYAWSLNNLGTLYWKMGLLEKAEAQLLQSKAIRERLFGKMHLDCAHSLNNLGLVYKDLDLLEKAEPFFLEAKEIRGQLLGRTHRDYAWSLNNLANLYWKMGDLEKAETLQLEALAIREKTAGKNSNDYAASLTNLGILYEAMGDFGKAESYYLRCKNLREALTETGHPDYAGVVSNLANLYAKAGEPEKAEPMFAESLRLLEKLQGKQHPSYAIGLLNMAAFYQEKEKWQQAEPLCMEAKSVIEAVLGKGHTDYAKCLLALGINQLGQKHFREARESLEQAKTIFQNKGETSRHEYRQIQGSLIQCHWESGDMAAAQQQILERSVGQQKQLTNAAKHLSERELHFYIHSHETELQEELSFAQNQPALTGLVFDDILFHKGFLLNAVQQTRKLAAENPAAAEQLAQLKSLNRRLAAALSKPIAARPNTAELEEKTNALEKELARAVANFGTATRQVSWQQVRDQLRPGEAAVEFIDYQLSNPQPSEQRMYAALVLVSGAARPVFVPLFEEQKLQALLDPKGKTRVDFVNQMYSKPALFDLVWKPLEAEIGGATTVYFAPSGLLHRLNFGAFAVGNQALAEQVRLVQLGSTRQLVVPAEAKTSEKTALLFGGIRYDSDSTAFADANPDFSEKLSGDFSGSALAARRGLGFENTDSTLRGGGNSWDFLKWTGVEIELAATILHDAVFKTEFKTGFAASEDFFKTVGTLAPSPQVLHLATHGFFFPDPNTGNAGHGARDDEPVFKISEHPMIRSGLVLAGGNHAWKTGKPLRPDHEDGILTAYEISQMNLSGTELVVLSACETGLGDLRGNEGVYGLQRAFRIAGAKYLVMSLWQTSDFHTQELMANFYGRWLDDKMPIPDAFRAAQQAVRARYPQPFYWAGFVLIGG